MSAVLVIEQTGFSTIQDLGRPGYAGIGVSANGALDQDAARTANVLVGNTESAALVETTGSDLAVRAEHDVLVSATGAAECLMVDGHPRPAWSPVPVPAGARIVVPLAALGYRTYLAVNGEMAGDRVLGSVAPDPLLETGRRLLVGDRLLVDSQFRLGRDLLATVVRLDGRPARSAWRRIRATPGPDLARLRDSVAGHYRLLAQSDHVGLRLTATAPLRPSGAGELLSRGVPVGAVEVPPSGELIILMRGRLVTAGYPVPAVVTTHDLDLLAQLCPGDSIDLVLTDAATARLDLRRRAAERAALAVRIRRLLESRGLHAALPHSPDPTARTA